MVDLHYEAFGHSAGGRCIMKAVMCGTFWILIALFSCGNQFDKNDSCAQPRDEQFKQEASQSGVVHPDTDAPQPHPILTPEEREQLLRLKDKNASPWETGAQHTGSSVHTLPSQEKTQDSIGTRVNKTGETE
jgi:hypothetical protein